MVVELSHGPREDAGLNSSLTIALDAMGGDRAPELVVEGTAIAQKRYPDAQFLLVGDEAELGPLFDRYPTMREGVHVRHTEESVGDEDKPSQALRHGTRSSMRVAVDAVRDGEAAGVVSAGNTGALMAMAKFVLKTLPGIDRPAMVGFFPTQRNESCMLDLGANVDCDANTLVQFAVMGAAFARIVLGIARPTVGLLNVGVEELKGNDAVKTAGQMLKEADLPMEFFGFVEGDDLAAGTVDVFVTDGFTGNVALKTAEGTARLYTSFLASAFRRSLLSRIGYLLAKPALESLRKRVDPRVYNGAVFVGLNGIVVKSHGSTDAMGFASAIGVAVDMAKGRISERIVADFQRFGASAAGPENRLAVS